MGKTRNYSDILNGGQTIHNENVIDTALTLTCPSSQTGNMLHIDGSNGNSFIVNSTGNPIMRGYSESISQNNTGTFDFTSANFFKCVPVGNITIMPVVGNLEVISATVHINNISAFTITMPPNTYWVNGEENLSITGKFVIVLYSFDTGTNWFATFIGDLPADAPF